MSDAYTRVFLRGENKITFPDRDADYYIGNYVTDETHFAFPLFMCYLIAHHEYSSILLNRHFVPLSKDVACKRDFCTFVASNWVDDRVRFTQRMMSSYKDVACGGKVLHNSDMDDNNKVRFISKYKFNIAFENTKDDYYHTEKILEPFIANTIPIYFGHETVFQFFNKDAFIYVKNEGDWDMAIERVKYLDTHDDEYYEMLNQPIFARGFSLEDYYCQFKHFIKKMK